MGRGPLPPRSSLQNYNGQDVTYSTEHKIITREEAVRWVRGLQAKGLKVVFTNGCFDLLHPGHVAYLEEARSLGDALLVAVNTDASVRRLGKGGLRPVNPEADRARVLAALAAVDRVVFFGEDTPLEILTELKPDILVKGGDYREHEVVGRDLILARGGEIRILHFRPGYSTSGLVARIRASQD
jgi:rfaE bifunctional protein nucleotidyltransferase chain/domain